MWYRWILLIVVFFASIVNGSSQNNEEKVIDLSISLVKEIPDTNNKERKIDYDIKLVILNNTDTAATFYRTWNSYGDNAIRFELTIKDSVFNLFYSSYCDTRNFPDAAILKPGDSLAIFIKFEKCFHNGPCPCLYSTSKGYRFPIDHLQSGKLRAYYKVDLENHNQAIASTFENINSLYSKKSKRRKLIEKEKKYFQSFVVSELTSNLLELEIDSW